MVNFKKAYLKTKKSVFTFFPVLMSVLFLMALVDTLLGFKNIGKAFGHGAFLDSLIGAAMGSVAVGNPLTSYIIGGDLFKSGVSLVAIIAFLTTWVTVGMVQIPAEMAVLGKRFTLRRNILAFFSAILVGIITALLV